MLKRIVALISLALPYGLLAQDTTSAGGVPPDTTQSYAVGPYGMSLLTVALIVFAIYIIVIFVYFGYLLHKTAELQRKNKLDIDMSRLPLGIPEGSVRSTVTMSFIFIFVLWLFVSTAVHGKPDVPEQLFGILMAIVGFYFGSRASSSAGGHIVPQERPGTIRGRVRLEGSNDHSGVRVKVEETGASAVTSSSGEFVIEDVPPGTYTLTFEREGYLDRTVDHVRVTSGSETSIGVIELIKLDFDDDEI